VIRNCYFVMRLKEQISRLRKLAWMIDCIFMSKSVYLDRMAIKIPGKAVQLSIVQRRHRFLVILLSRFVAGTSRLLVRLQLICTIRLAKFAW